MIIFSNEAARDLFYENVGVNVTVSYFLVEKIVIKCNISSNFVPTGLENATLKTPNSDYERLEVNECALPDSEKFLFNFLKNFHTTFKGIDIVKSKSKLTRKQFKGLPIEKLTVTKSVFNVSDDLLYDLPSLAKFMIYDSKNFTKIPNGFFQNSNNLIELDFSKTQLVRIQKNDFSHLTKLNYLKLIWNPELEEIEPEAFSSLSLLTKFMISDSKLKTLPVRIFKNFENLQELYLEKSKFNNLSANLLNDLKKQTLEKFDLIENRGLSTLPEEFFKNSKKLRHISLKNNNFDTLPEKLFKGLESLLELDLSKNKFKNLSESLFNETKCMRRLDLSDNELETISNSLFDNMNLDELTITNNRLSILSS